MSLTAEQLRRARSALIVGVDDYAIWGRSLPNPARANLGGAVLDARMFADVLSYALVVPQKTELLLAPRGGAGQRVTRAHLLESFDRFLSRAADQLAPSIFYFAGRGAWCSSRGLLICPADTEGPGLENAVALTELNARADARGAPGLIFVFDCGFTGGAPDVSWARSRHLPRRSDPAPELPVHRATDCHLFAGPRGAPVYERKFKGWHGLHTWTLCHTIRQAFVTPGDRVGSMSWRGAAARAENVARAMGFPHAPVIQGAGPAAFTRVMVDPTDESLSAPSAQIHAGTMDVTSDTDPPAVIGHVVVNAAETTEDWYWKTSAQAWPSSFRLVERTTSLTVPSTFVKESQPHRRFNLAVDPVTALPATTDPVKTYTITRVTKEKVTMRAGWMRVRTDLSTRPQTWFQAATEYMEISVATDSADRGKTYLRFVADNAAPEGVVFQT